MAETKADKLAQFAATLEDGLIPKATQLLSGTTTQLPSFVGPTDPTTIPELAAIMVPGSLWTDTTADPAIAGAAWVDPLTGLLHVSAGGS